MFKTIQSLRPLAAPATAVLLLGTLFILEERHFDQKSALLLALLTGVAVAEILPAAALGLVFAALVLQSLKVLPLVLLSGVLSYAVVPVVIFFAVHRLENPEPVGPAPLPLSYLPASPPSTGSPTRPGSTSSSATRYTAGDYCEPSPTLF